MTQEEMLLEAAQTGLFFSISFEMRHSMYVDGFFFFFFFLFYNQWNILQKS